MSPTKQQYCHPYIDKRTGASVEGCGKPVKWEQTQTQWGLKNQKQNMDGSKHVCQGGVKMPERTADMEPAEYAKLTGMSHGLQEAKANSYLKEYFDNNLKTVIKDCLDEVLDDHLTKASSNNVTLATIGKDVTELRQEVQAVLAQNSFKTGSELYDPKHNKAPVSPRENVGHEES